MVAMRKRLLFPLLIACWTAAVAVQPGAADATLEELIRARDWPALAARFADDSHRQLAAYFDDCQEVGFTPVRPDTVMFFARFAEFAEIGELSFTARDGRWQGLALKRTIKPLHFIRQFRRYAVAGLRLRMGDAEILFRRGSLYRGLPMGNVFLFQGEWAFRIRPDSEEERLTLAALERSDVLVREARAGVFVVNRPDELLQGLPEPEPSAAPADEEAQALYREFQGHWGMPVSLLGELWYFPFAPDFSAALFADRPGRSHFRYIFNSAISPDTSLVLLPENKFFLSYNAVKGLKFSQGGVDELERLQLNLFVNPQDSFLSATSVLNFKEPASVKTVTLHPGLVVKGFGRSQQHELQLFHRDDTYYLLGEELKKFSFYYAGSVASAGEGDELAPAPARRPGRELDPCYVLDRDQGFYPNPGQHFFKSLLRVSLPAGLECLATGRLRSRQRLGDRNEFVFEGESKGVSLACGPFVKLATLPGDVPLHVFGNPRLRMRDAYSAEALRGYLDFLAEKFGPLSVPEVNLLLRRRPDFGGWSQQGFVICNLLESTLTDDDVSRLRRLRADSPVVFGDINRDNLVHELAHQWWGGIVSWKSYQDQWLTEGLAQFATLLYLENTLGAGNYRRVLAASKRWVARKNDAGPIVYGRRIANLSGDLQAFQSVVYNKAALVFLMLKEMLGEEEMLERLRRVLADCRHQSLTSARFIQLVSRGEERLQKFFQGWVFTRRLPKARAQVVLDGRSAAVTVTQVDGDFVFPLSLRVSCADGKYTRTLIVEKPTQTFRLFENTTIQSLQVESPVAPVELLAP